MINVHKGRAIAANELRALDIPGGNRILAAVHNRGILNEDDEELIWIVMYVTRDQLQTIHSATTGFAEGAAEDGSCSGCRVAEAL